MDTRIESTGICQLCSRETDNISDHHLIPKCRSKNKRIKKRHSRDVIRRKVPFCQPCHHTVHRFFTEKDLADSFCTIDALVADEAISKYLIWIQKQKRNFRV